MKKQLSLTQIEFRTRLFAFIIPGVLVGIAVILVLIANSMTSKIIKDRQDGATKSVVNSEQQAFNKFIIANQINLENLNRIIPNETMMISVIQDFESVITSIDPLGTVEISSATPAKIGAYSAISLDLKLSSGFENLPFILEKINKLPYMTQLLTIDTNQIGETYAHQLGIRLYVQDPFTAP